MAQQFLIFFQLKKYQKLLGYAAKKLTPSGTSSLAVRLMLTSTQFTCFTGTIVRILTLLFCRSATLRMDLFDHDKNDQKSAFEASFQDTEDYLVLGLLALLVQKCKY